MKANPVTLDGASRDVPRDPSPFQDGTLSFTDLDLVKAYLAKQPNLSEPTHASGMIVLSAIVFGALLDENAANAWLELLLSGAVDRQCGWVDRTPPVEAALRAVPDLMT